MAEQKLQLEDCELWTSQGVRSLVANHELRSGLDDLCVRFILNLPEDDLSSVARICFQVEEAQWFYEDFIRPLDPTLPSMSLRSFCLRIFKHCPLLASFPVENHMRAFEEFLTYKTRIPVRGAILLNGAMDSTILVKGWKKGANWSFPRGKINKDEDDLVCAIREVYEETGFDLKEAGLIPKGEDVKYIQISIGHQQIRLYVFRDVPMNTVFEPKTRKEISKIQWYRLSELPAFRKKGNQQDDAVVAINANKFYMVAPFLVPLKKWVVAQKKKDAAKSEHLSAALNEEACTEDDIANQTETAVEGPKVVSSNGTPKAELELRRLLNLQPSTPGMQPTINNPHEESEDHAQALLEILRSSSSKKTDMDGGNARERAPITSATHGPRTPFESTDSQPPEPKTPHHHHPTSRLGAFDKGPPPSFPLAPQALSNQHDFVASYYPPAGWNHAAPHPANATAQNASHRQHAAILHPQPLPPHVQTSRFARDLGQTPSLSEAICKMPAQPSQHLMSSLSGMTGDRITGNQLEQQATHAASTPSTRTTVAAAANATPQLSSQQMSLLSALKGRTLSKQNPTSTSVPLVTDMPTGRSFPGEPTTKQSSQAAGPSLQPSVDKAVPHHRLLSLLNPGNMIPAAQPANGGAATCVLPTTSSLRPLAANSSHRAELLDLFRKPATPTTGADGMINPAKPADIISVLPGPGIENTVPKLSVAPDDVLGSRSGVNCDPVPAGAGFPVLHMALPTRSNPGEVREGTFQHAPPYFVSRNGSSSLVYPGAGGNTQNGLPASQDYPILLHRGQTHGDKLHGAQQLSQPTASFSQQAGTQSKGNYQGMTSSSARGSALEYRDPSRVSVPDYRREQQQKLLTLLKAKSPAVPTTSAKDSGASRPQVPSLSLSSEHKQNGDAGGLLGSRRESQTPNSPGQEFLLNYLMSKSGACQK